MKNKERKKINLSTYILMLIMIALICGALIYLIATGTIGNKGNKQEVGRIENNKIQINNQNEEEIKNKIIGHKLCDFDLSFLKVENNEENKIYSPLSIKAAMKMLEEGAQGESKAQITKYIGEYSPTNYKTTSNRAFANALFVRDTYKIKDSYTTTLKTKYNAEVISDSFSSPKNVNNWVSKHTLNLIDNLLDNIDDETNFILINALGIDMDWKDKFLSLEDGRK